MKIHIAKFDESKMGGGWSFCRNLAKAIPDHLVSYEESEIYLIPSPSMVTKEEVDQAQSDGKNIVLRVDNIVRNSRNRNTGMSRMKRFAEQANLVIYQSEFARTLLLPFLGRDGVVILNSVDTNIFNPSGRMENEVAKYMYSRVNRDETKNWEMARLLFQQENWKRRGRTKLNIVGQFSPELIEYNFDFYMDEDYNYWGTISDPSTLASIYRDSDYFIYSYWNDACSNSLIEALCCGCIISDPHNMLLTGGAPEIVENFVADNDYFKLDRMGRDYLEAMKTL